MNDCCPCGNQILFDRAVHLDLWYFLFLVDILNQCENTLRKILQILVVISQFVLFFVFIYRQILHFMQPDQRNPAPVETIGTQNQPHLPPNQPQIHLDQPQIHPDQPQIHPNQPQTHPNQPQIHPNQPQIHSDQPQIHPEPQNHPIRIHPQTQLRRSQRIKKIPLKFRQDV